MYEKTEWKARKGVNLNRFEKSQETDRHVVLENAPTLVTEPGTPFNSGNMNKIEQGIYDAHEMVAGKADKVRGATEGNFAEFNSSGNLSDSGKKTADFVFAGEKGAAGGVATLGANGTIPANQLPSSVGVNLPAAVIIALTRDNQQAALAAMYGGTWGRVINPPPRTLVLSDSLGSAGTGHGSGTGEIAINHSGAGAGSIVTVNLGSIQIGWIISLKSSTRGILQTVLTTEQNYEILILNSVVLQFGESLSLVAPNAVYTIYWTAGHIAGNSVTEYLYVRTGG